MIGGGGNIYGGGKLPLVALRVILIFTDVADGSGGCGCFDNVCSVGDDND